MAPGELVALVGGSGAGKTTLLETMAGLRPPSAGAVLHDGDAVASGTAARIGFVPQDHIIHRDLPLRRTLRGRAAVARGHRYGRDGADGRRDPARSRPRRPV